MAFPSGFRQRAGRARAKQRIIEAEGRRYPVDITVSGVIHGRRIDLDEEASLPDGAPVVVRIEARDLGLKQRENLVVATAGAWAGDPTLERILEEIARTRSSDMGRPMTFDDPT